jgi:hypothetical protein
MNRREGRKAIGKVAGMAAVSLALWLGAAVPAARAGSYLELGSFDKNDKITLRADQYSEGSTYNLYFSTDAGDTWSLWKGKKQVFETASATPTVLDLGLGIQEKKGSPTISYSLGNGDAVIFQDQELAAQPGYFKDIKIVWKTPGFGYSLTTESVLGKADGMKAVPLPATALLFSSFLGGLGLFGRRKFQA